MIDVVHGIRYKYRYILIERLRDIVVYIYANLYI